MKSLSQVMRDWIDRLDQLTTEDPQDDNEQSYAAKFKLTQQGSTDIAKIVQYLSSPEVGGKLVKHPRLPDVLIFLPKESITDSAKFVDYFEKLTDDLAQQLDYQPFVDFAIVAAEPFADQPPLK